MAKAIITIEDIDGQIALSCDFGDGFDNHSHAHQHANLVIKTMDELADKRQPATEGNEVE